MKNLMLITGTTSGVGLSLAQHFSDRFDIIAIGRKSAELQKLSGNNPKITSYTLDLSDHIALAKTLDEIIDKYQYIPYLINNAGVNIKGSCESLSFKDITYSFQVNAISPLMIMQKLLPAMKKNNFGRIVNLTSGAPMNCFPEYAAYSASKGALNAFTVTAAKEYEKYNIKINLMSPGPVRSNMAPVAPMEPTVCHPTADYLISLDENGPTGRFFWLGHEIPLFPDLEGIQWLEGKAHERFRRVI
jgi:short-subunit dehydrogenase